MTLVLIAAMAVSFGTRDWISGGVIFALVGLNVITGTMSEWKAAKTVAALESVVSPIATVVRHQGCRQAKTETIPVEDVVPAGVSYNAFLHTTCDEPPSDTHGTEASLSRELARVPRM